LCTCAACVVCVSLLTRVQAWMALIVLASVAFYVPVTIVITEHRGKLRRDLNSLDNKKSAKARRRPTACAAASAGAACARILFVSRPIVCVHSLRWLWRRDAPCLLPAARAHLPCAAAQRGTSCAHAARTRI
jgi:hypothetical protein